MTSPDDGGQAAQASTNSDYAASGLGRSGDDEWRIRNHELREEFFTLMDRLAAREITAAKASSETARINREMATLIRLTLEKRRS